MVRVVVESEEIGRRRDGLHDKAAASGFRRFLDLDDEEAMCDRAISIVGSVFFFRSETEREGGLVRKCARGLGE